jgi:amino acid transporter
MFDSPATCLWNQLICVSFLITIQCLFELVTSFQALITLAAYLQAQKAMQQAGLDFY